MKTLLRFILWFPFLVVYTATLCVVTAGLWLLDQRQAIKSFYNDHPALQWFAMNVSFWVVVYVVLYWGLKVAGFVLGINKGLRTY